MSFPKRYAEIAACTRVSVGAILAAVFLFVANPSWQSLGIGGFIGTLGLVLRGWAAGHLAKYEELATSGPYAYTRNPLYLGTLISAVGCAVAGSHVGIAIAVPVFFILFYLPVIEEEERFMRETFDGYAAYEKRVAKFLPTHWMPSHCARGFRRSLYEKNRESRALIVFAFMFVILVVKMLYGP